jgi:hypothetical protein
MRCEIIGLERPHGTDIQMQFVGDLQQTPSSALARRRELQPRRIDPSLRNLVAHRGV